MVAKWVPTSHLAVLGFLISAKSKPITFVMSSPSLALGVTRIWYGAMEWGRPILCDWNFSCLINIRVPFRLGVESVKPSEPVDTEPTARCAVFRWGQFPVCAFAAAPKGHGEPAGPLRTGDAWPRPQYGRGGQRVADKPADKAGSAHTGHGATVTAGAQRAATGQHREATQPQQGQEEEEMMGPS